MYNVRHLFRIARAGLADLIPAVRQAFNDDPSDDGLDRVYGSSPRGAIVGIAVVCVLGGAVFSALVPAFGPNFGSGSGITDYVNWSAVAASLGFAAILRRYLFKPMNASPAQESDFPWLAASLAAPVSLLALASLVSNVTDSPDDSMLIGRVAVAAAEALGAAAAMTIAVATLCFSKEWVKALTKLAVRLLVFRIMVFVTTLVVLEIGIVGPIVESIVGGIFDIRLPDWVGPLLDDLSYAGLMSVIYLAVIGATWTVCRQSFGELLKTGEVDILKTIEDLAVDPKRKAKIEKKKEKKEQKRLKKQSKAK